MSKNSKSIFLGKKSWFQVIKAYKLKHMNLKMKIILLITHFNVILNPSDLYLSSENILRYLR